MTWSPAFVRRLESRGVLTPIFILEVTKNAVGAGVGQPVRISSAPFEGCYCWLDPSEVRLGGSRVTPVSWSFQAAACKLKIDAKAPSRITLASSLRRGALCRLRMGFPGDNISQFETIFLGTVRTIESRAPGAWDVELWDIVSSLSGRVTTNTQAVQLFQKEGVEGTTTLGATYNPGDTSMEVADTAGFVFENGSSGLVRLQCPHDGSDFLLTYTGIASGPPRLTGLSATGQFGTTAATCSVGHGADITNIPYLYGPLYTIWSKLALSTGTTGANGPRDTLPESWGFALNREDVDVVDGERFAQAITPPSSGTADVHLYELDDVQDSLSWLAGVLSPYGLWLCVRQGKLTIRGVQDISEWSNVRARSVFSIGDSDILIGENGEGLVVEMYDTDRQLEYASTTVASATYTTTTFEPTVGTFPAGRNTSYSVPFVWQNETAICNEIMARLHPWAVSLGEALVLKLSGLHWMQLVPGDVVRLDIARASGRHRSSLVGWSNRPALVVEVSPNLYDCSVTVRVATLPIDRYDDWGA